MYGDKVLNEEQAKGKVSDIELYMLKLNSLVFYESINWYFFLQLQFVSEDGFHAGVWRNVSMTQRITRRVKKRKNNDAEFHISTEDPNPADMHISFWFFL